MKTLVRRGAAVPALAVAALALASCSSGGSADGADASSGAWTFTDDVGVTVTLDRAPERVASYADYALGLHSLDVDPVAVFGRVPVATDERFADYDLSDVAVVGNSYGEVDIEAMAAADPDVIVVGIYPTDGEGTLDLEGPRYSLQDTAQQQQLEAIAPLITIEVGGKGQDVVDSLNRLALALGAEQSTVDEAKSEFDAAAADLADAAETSGVEVTQMYADASSGIYVAKPDDEPEMELYRQYGVDFTDLNPDDGNYYWDVYSWENASQMSTGDVLLVNVEGFQADDLAAQPTFASHPALVAGQVHAWNGAAMDYRSQAAHMAELAEILRSSQDVNPA